MTPECPFCDYEMKEHAPGFWSCPDPACPMADCSLSDSALQEIERRNGPKINPCPECGEPCRIVAVRCDKVVVCCTYPRMEAVRGGGLQYQLLHGCGYMSPMERHPLDCIERHNRETEGKINGRRQS